MKFKQVVHPEIVLGKRYDDSVYGNYKDLYQKSMQILDYDEKNKIFYVNQKEHGLGDYLDEEPHFLNHVMMIKRFFMNHGKYYHINKDFLIEISKVKKNVPYHYMPKRFSAYFSFPRETLFDERKDVIDHEVLGAYVFLGPAYELGVNEGSFSSEMICLAITYIQKDGHFMNFFVPFDRLNEEELKFWIKKNMLFNSEVLIHNNGIEYEFKDIVLRTCVNLICYIHQPDPHLQRIQPLENYTHKKRIEIRNQGLIQNECTLPITFINWGWQGL